MCACRRVLCASMAAGFGRRLGDDDWEKRTRLLDGRDVHCTAGVEVHSAPRSVRRGVLPGRRSAGDQVPEKGGGAVALCSTFFFLRKSSRQPKAGS